MASCVPLVPRPVTSASTCRRRRERRMGRLTMDKTRLAIGLVFIAAIGSGIVPGVFFAFSSFVMAALRRISPARAVGAMESINVTVVNPGFAFLGTGILCLVVGVRSLFSWNHAGAGPALLASLAYLAYRSTISLHHRRSGSGNCVLAAISQGMDYLESSAHDCSGLVRSAFYHGTVSKLTEPLKERPYEQTTDRESSPGSGRDSRSRSRYRG